MNIKTYLSVLLNMQLIYELTVFLLQARERGRDWVIYAHIFAGKHVFRTSWIIAVHYSKH